MLEGARHHILVIVNCANLQCHTWYLKVHAPSVRNISPCGTNLSTVDCNVKCVPGWVGIEAIAQMTCIVSANNWTGSCGTLGVSSTTSNVEIVHHHTRSRLTFNLKAHAPSMSDVSAASANLITSDFEGKSVWMAMVIIVDAVAAVS